MRRRINYFASMEDIEQDNAELIVDTISDPVVQLVDKTYPNKIDDQITEGDLISTDIERATEDVKLLEEVKDITESTIESGEGLSPTAASIVQHTLEALYKRHGVRKHRIPKFVSIENFSHKRTRLISTKIALESIVDLIGVIGKYIVSKTASLFNWFSVTWEKMYSVFTNFHALLAGVKKKLSSVKSIRGQGKVIYPKWLNRIVFDTKPNTQWVAVSSSIKNTIRATDTERKSWKMIQEYLGNPSKNLSSLYTQDPFRLGSFSSFLGLGRYVKRSTFSLDNNRIAGIEIPSIPQLTELVDDAMSLVGPAAITQYENIKKEIYKYQDLVVNYKPDTSIKVDSKGKLLTGINTKPDVKREFQIAMDLSRDLIKTFWTLRKNACRATLKLSNYFIERYCN